MKQLLRSTIDPASPGTLSGPVAAPASRRMSRAIAALALALAGLTVAGGGCGRTAYHTAARPEAPATAPADPHAAPGIHRAPAAASAATPGAPSQPAPQSAPAERPGGPVAAVQRYFKDLAGNRYAAAYALLSPDWRHTHSFASFRAGLPANPPHLVSARIQSAADFDATVDLTLRTASGGTRRFSAALIDLAQGPSSTAFSNWRLTRPVPTG